MVKQRHQLFVFLLAVADGLVVATAAMLAWLLRKSVIPLDPGYRFWPESWETWFKEPLLLFAVPITIYLMWLSGMYKPRRDRSIWGEYGHVLRVSAVAVVAMVVVLWAIGNRVIGAPKGSPTLLIGEAELDAGRVQLGLLAALLPLSLIAHRTTFRVALRIIRRRGMNLRHAAVIGVGRVGRIACQTLDRNPWTGIRVGYFISHKDRTERTECLGRSVAGGLAQLERILEKRPVDAVYIAIPNAQAAVLPTLLQRLDKFAVDVRIIPDVNPRYLPQSMALGELDGMPILSYRESPIRGLGGLAKRALDITGALAGIALFAVPMLLVALAVRLSGPGPVIFRQRRVSFGRDVFEIYKFRTMRYVEDEAGVDVSWTRRDDARITPVGRWLRRTSLDELPQLFNVLRGEMSLVGPRPERPELIERFREDWRGYMLRQHVKAGMTGWAQVNGLRGDTSIRKRIQYDLFYIRRWSIAFDLKILWLTVFRGFVHRNAH
jgi:Undecaprenyl-phosphate glucose phosphotransferase